MAPDKYGGLSEISRSYIFPKCELFAFSCDVACFSNKGKIAKNWYDILKNPHSSTQFSFFSILKLETIALVSFDLNYNWNNSKLCLWTWSSAKSLCYVYIKMTPYHQNVFLVSLKIKHFTDWIELWDYLQHFWLRLHPFLLSTCKWF